MSADVVRLRKVLEHIRSLPVVDSGVDEDGWQPDNWLVEHGVDGDGWQQNNWLVVDDAITITDQGAVDQSGTRCGTAACFAGWAVLMFAPNGTQADYREMVTKLDGARIRVPDYAVELLGLDMHNADRLFDANNTLSDLERIVTELEGDQG
jgi:hypothetical protein